MYRKTIPETFVATANTAYVGSFTVAPDSGTLNEIVKVNYTIDSGYGQSPNQTVDSGNYYNSSTNYSRIFARTNTVQIRFCGTTTVTVKVIAQVYYTKTTD